MSQIFARIASQKDENVVTSCLCMNLALLMAANGANSTTLSEFLHVTRFASLEEANKAVERFYIIFDNAMKRRELAVANALFIDERFSLYEEYLSKMNHTFRSESKRLCLDSDASVQQINKWVEEQTNQKIKKLLPREAVTRDTKLVLLNAIYFKCNWMNKFDKKATRDAKFCRDASSEQLVASMVLEDKMFFVGSNDEAKWIHLPYQNNEFFMVLVLPQQRFGLCEIIPQFASGEMPFLTSGYDTTVDYLQLPKFKYEFSESLQEMLQAEGLVEAFSDADFSRMTSEEGLYISAVLHKAFIQVDEEGTEAAAATGVVISQECESLPFQFIVDQPFLFAIVHRESHTILFEGKVVQPSF